MLIYLDTSVALAHLLSEDRAPDSALWEETLVSSRLLEYELWTRIHARRLQKTHADAVRTLVGRVALLELVAPILARATEPFRTPVRTLDALHLATMAFLVEQGQRVQVASYDSRLLTAAKSLAIPAYRPL